ncbi:phytolongin Phyl2.2-like [Prosopis cineraria]|uniref:phytolongin Phyl2.2-like n=1 Tax=Prosopis cineraria TaxID=364024 RepID=UPI00240F7D7C|nr:phytolongin Phyl2.2-like [Prosopis cineraria]
MISSPNFIHYACVAKGTTILAQHGSKEPHIEELAAKCLEQAPLHHCMFSHSVKNRTYAFLIDQAFVYFAIFDEKLLKSEALWFLDRIKCALNAILKGRSITDSDDFSPLCFQAQFDPIFGESMTSDLESEKPLQGQNKDDRKPSVGSVKGKKSMMVPLLEQPSKSLKKKRRVSVEGNVMDGKDAAMENKLEMGDDINCCTRDFALSAPKGRANDRQKAKQIWKKHVCVVLLLDVLVCAMLFVIWLWVYCRGYKCMQS